jgi:hypothetical protein
MADRALDARNILALATIRPRSITAAAFRRAQSAKRAEINQSKYDVVS